MAPMKTRQKNLRYTIRSGFILSFQRLKPQISIEFLSKVIRKILTLLLIVYVHKGGISYCFCKKKLKLLKEIGEQSLNKAAISEMKRKIIG
jgi:hypothetical protein